MADPAKDELTALERELLDFEAAAFPGAGAKEQAIRVVFGWSANGYYQRLNALLQRQAALEYAPSLVYRVRRRRTAAQRARSARSGGVAEPR
ncbi:DUF3263 domain-containing protein [Phycicoccus sp. M110.8]|uniref:DUF3263 domain-containing protein n=1 Tax=Phycicoccus sp. M110.8 TaxID=3075433 RepID=UPI0028FD027F|nr:DUF3263 domain-containing protein [Phycicoccus sp. M110.8]MDU0314083.1 DUF3263 domain-containing protein [Phycicoccus sp. M110.8]